MTNPVSPTPPPSGGMPKWVIILVVILVVVIFGCCGGIATCVYLARKATQKIQENAPALQQRIEQAVHDAQSEAEKRAAEAQAANNGNPAPAVTNDAATPNTPAANNNAGNTPADNLPATKLPSNFPSDIPVYSGLTPNFSNVDNIKNTGTVVFTGSGDATKVADYYQKEMVDKGWKLETNQSYNNNTVLKFTKDTNTSDISVIQTDKQVMVSITYGKQ